MEKKKKMNESEKKDKIKEYISLYNDKTIEAMYIVYGFQTSEEKDEGECRRKNGKGFSKYDIGFVESVKNQWEERKYLSSKQWDALKRCIGKYAGQVAMVSDKRLSLFLKRENDKGNI